MKRKHLKCLLFLVAVASAAVPLSAFADPICPFRIVVGQKGPYDLYGFFNSGTINSAIIPSVRGIEYICTYETQTGETNQKHMLNANQLIKSIGTGWQKVGNVYTCTRDLDCSAVIEEDLLLESPSPAP